MFLGVEFLGPVAKLRKSTINFVLSARPSVRKDQFGSQDIHEIECFSKNYRGNSSLIEISQE